MRIVLLWIILSLSQFALAGQEKLSDAAPPSVSSLLKPQIYNKVRIEREVVTHANLSDVSGGQKYDVYAAMLVKAPLKKTREALTDYRLYPKMIPYIEKADFTPAARILQVEGGIWKFKVITSVQFEDVSERWTKFRVVAGHFTGLSGDIFYENAGEKGTLVYFRGEQSSNHFPPKFLLERGAEIVFGFTARRMRTYIETESKAVSDGSRTEMNSVKTKGTENESRNDTEVPQPRSHL